VVVLVVLFVVVPIVLGAVLYIMVSGLIGTSQDGFEPVVQLGQADPSAGNLWRVQVAGVSEAERLYRFRVILLEDDTLRSEIDPLAEGTFGNLSFVDLDGGGTLSTGDFFSVTCGPMSEYRLTIIWRDSGNLVGEETWATW
jgi:hypothetical protein